MIVVLRRIHVRMVLLSLGDDWIRATTVRIVALRRLHVRMLALLSLGTRETNLLGSRNGMTHP
jgi:hypothetical protein